MTRHSGHGTPREQVTDPIAGGEPPSCPTPPPPPDYRAWCDRQRLTEADAQLMAERMMRHWKHYPAIHLIAVVQPGQESRLAETIGDLNCQLYRGWGLTVFAAIACPETSLGEAPNLEWIQADGDVTAQVHRAIEGTGADWVALLQAGDRLEPHLLFACADHINRHPRWRLLYVDEDTIDGRGQRSDPHFKPDFNLDLLRSTPYTGSFCLVQREALERAGGWVERGGLENYDATLRIFEAYGEDAIGHVPQMLYHRRDANRRALLAPDALAAGQAAVADHLTRCGVHSRVSAGLLPGSHFIEYLHRGQPKVSIIIASQNRPESLTTCVESVLAKTQYANYEILIVEEPSTAADTTARLRALESAHPSVRVLTHPNARNASAMRNLAARTCAGEYLLFLDQDTVIVQGQWLDRLLGHGRRAEVGVVGARLVAADRRIEHAGLVLGMGPNGIADTPFGGLPLDTAAMMGRAQVAQSYSAVSGSCLLIRRGVFDNVGGMDAERLPAAYGDVDLCMRVRQAGYKIVWTPFATVVRGTGHLPPAQPREAALDQVTTVLERWLPQLARDPAYNRQLTLLDGECSPEQEIDIPWEDQSEGPLRILGTGLGYGALHYRVGQPLAALKEHARARVGIIPSHHEHLRVPSVTELERAGPDALLLHNGIHDLHLDALKWYRRFNRVFTVFSQDDLIFDLPPDHPGWAQRCVDAEDRVRSALSCCDRLIVTTEALADAHRDMIDDIRVLPNYLDRKRWGHLQARRRAGPRPRVGWAGAQQHHGDLKLLIEAVQATARDVDWVFFGMCPDDLLPVVKEFHRAVSFEQYPDKLASLDLDIAVAPLAINRFNECKSNLRLLEYGVLGWPVICTDITPYRNAPVQRVANRPEAWIDAIMDNARDLDAAARQGDRLREWVRQGWMLDDHLDEWLCALSPGTVSEQRRACGDRIA